MLTAPLLVALAAPAGFAIGGCVGAAASRLLRRRALAARRILAAISAGAALLAPAAPTGIASWDALLRAGLGAGVVLLAGCSRPAWWVPAAAVAVVGAAGSDAAMAAALGILGAVVALVCTTHRAPVAGAAVGAALVQVALHLHWPGSFGATSAMAVLVLAPLVVSGLRRSPGAERRTIVRVAVVAGVVAAAGVVTGGGAGLIGASRVEKGASALTAGLEAARRGDQVTGAEALRSAARSFADARRVIEAPWLLPAHLVPVVSQHLQALQGAARAGNELALTGASTVATADLRALRVDNGRVDLERVGDLEAPLARAAAGLAAARDRLRDDVASPWLVAPVAGRLRRELGRIDRTQAETELAGQVTAQLPGLLGAGGPRRYFLAIQTPSELRGSGGIIGSFGEITAEDGTLAIGRFGRDGDLNSQGTPPDQRILPGPPDYVARYSRFEPQRIWQNVSMSPHFPSVAAVIGGLYPQSGGTAVDGVVSVDPVALAALLRVVGPVTVAPWPEPITADNAERILLFDQYVRLEGTARTDFLGDVAEAVAGRLTSGPLPPPDELVRALGPAVRGHHLLLSSTVASEQALFARIGADGALPVVGGDSLAVVNGNAGGNKLDWFLRRSTRYEARLDAGTGRLTARLTVTMRNEAPASGLPGYIIGSSRVPPDPSGVNRTYLSVFSPLALTGARLEGEALLVESEREAGRNVFSQFVVIPPGETRTVTFDLAGVLPAGRRYRLDLRSQALVVPETVAVEVTDGGRRVVTRPSSALAGDKTLRR